MKTKTKKLLVVLLAAALVLSSLAIVISAVGGGSAEDGGKKINVWLIAGQSNAVGYGKVANYAGADGELLDRGVSNVLYFSRGYGEVADDFVSVRFGFGQNGAYSGAELGLATALANSGEQHAIIKYANGDTQLSALNVNSETNVSTWTPPSYIEAHPEIEFEGDKIGDLYNGLIATVTEGIAKLRADGYTPVVQGIWWMQGERDGNHAAMTAELYSELLRYLVSDLRADVGGIMGADLSTLPFVYGRIYRNPEYAPNSEAGLAGVIGGQDAFAADTNNVNVSMLDTRSELIDLHTREHVDLVQQDGWHYDSYTQQLMGEAFVRKVNAMKPVCSDTKSINILSGEQALYTAALNYVTGTTLNVKLGSTQLFTLSDNGLNILDTNIKGVYPSGDYTVYVCVNPAQNMTMVEVVLPGGGVLRRGTYGKTSGTSMVASAEGEGRIKNTELKYEYLTLNSYEIVTDEPQASGFAANVYNLMNSFGDSTSDRLFAWTAKAEFIGTRTMAIKYRVKGTSEWSSVDAYKLTEPTEYADEDYFKADISGLTPASEYEYKIGVKGSTDEVNEWSKSYFFTTASGGEKEFTFIAVGDTQGITWAGTETSNKGYIYTKAAYDEAFEEVKNPAFILHTGDVVEEGLKEDQWNLYFKALGEAGASVPHFATVGNHDDNLATADQNFYFGMHLNHPDNGGNAYLDPTVVSVINSLDPETAKDAKWVQLLIKYMDETFYSYNYGDAHFIVYNSGAYSSQDELMMKAQRAWLKADLEANKDAKWTVVLAHQANYHLYGGSYSRSTLADIIEGFDVDLVVQGHSHLVTRSYPMKDGKIVTKENPGVITKGDGTVYMLIGATALNHDPINYKGYANEENLAVAVSNVGTQPSYATFNVTENSIEVTVKQVNGLVLDKFSIVEPEEEKKEKENVEYYDDFHYFTYNDLAALGLWETEVYSSTVKYTAKAPSYSALRLKLSDKQSVQFNWLKAIGGIQNYDPNDTYVFEFDANVTSWGTNSAPSTRTLYVAPGGYYNQVGLHHSDTTMQVGEAVNGVYPSYTYSGEETFHIKIEWHGKTIISTVTDTKGTTITGSRTKDNYVNVATDPLLQTMVFRCEDGTVYIDNFSFKSLSDIEIDGYGTIPSNYADASVYPIVLFQGGAFKSAFGPDKYTETINAALSLVDYNKNATAPAQILFRGNASATGKSDNMGRANGTIDVNLNGYTLSQNDNSYLFFLRTKSYTDDEQTMKLNVHDGNIVMNYILFNTGAQQSGSDNANLNNAEVSFDRVNISIIRGKEYANPPKSLIFFEDSGSISEARVDKTVDFKFTFNDCIFDFSRYNYGTTVFDVNHSADESVRVHKFDVDVNGGEIILSSIGAKKSTIFAKNSVSDITFGKGASGSYTKLTVPTGAVAAAAYSNDMTLGSATASFKKVSEDALTTTYAPEATEAVQGIYIDGYGILPNAYADASKYPIVLFYDGEFREAFASDQFKAALEKTRAYVGSHTGVQDHTKPAAQILLRGDATSTARDENFGQTVGTVDINLNGHTLTDTSGTYMFYLRTKTYSTHAQKLTLNVRGGTLNFGYVLFAVGTQQNSASLTTSYVKNADVNFTDVVIKQKVVSHSTNAGPIFNASHGTNYSSDKQVEFNFTFTDCTFDLSELGKANSIFNINDTSTDTVNKINLQINGGEMIFGKGNKTGTNPYASKIYDVNSVSSLTFGKGSNGEYPSVTVPTGVTASILTNKALYTDAPITSAGSAGKAAKLMEPVTLGEWITYTMRSEITIDGYGTVTPDYSNADNYPILLFQGGAFKQAFAADQFAEATNVARALVDYNVTNPAPAQILLRGNATAASYGDQNLARATGLIDVNLNGYTLTQDYNSYLFLLRIKDYAAADEVFKLNIRDGKIVLNNAMFGLSAQGTSHKGNINNALVNVTNVEIVISRATTATVASPLFITAPGGNGNTTGDADIDYTFNFTDCIFDFSGMKTVDAIFNMDNTVNNTVCNLDVNVVGGELKLSGEAAASELYKQNGTSSLTFAKGTNNKYMTVEIPETVRLATFGDSVKVAEGIECTFAKASTSDGYANFSLYPSVMLGYKIKSSITLYSNLVYNIYVPAKDFVSAIRIDGVLLSDTDYATENVTLDGVDYVKISVPLAAKQSLSDISVKVSLISGESAVNASWTVSVAKYAKLILDSDAGAEEKALVKDILSFARAAYAYFTDAADEAEKLAYINTVLGEGYDATHAPDMTKDAKTPAAGRGFKSVTVNLAGTPSYRFYLADGFGYDDFVFAVGGARVEAKQGTNENGAYLEVDMYAYKLLEDVSYTVTVDGTEYTESYNLYAYYNYVKTEKPADTALHAIVERLAAYAESARAFKLSSAN